MPSETFFRLPEAKRNKLIKAAREVFSETPYESASLNQIIRRAGIPRGSFYMYFADKEELFSYLMTGYAGTVSRAITEQLRASGGDPFAGMPFTTGRSWKKKIRRGGRNGGTFSTFCA